MGFYPRKFSTGVFFGICTLALFMFRHFIVLINCDAKRGGKFSTGVLCTCSHAKGGLFSQWTISLEVSDPWLLLRRSDS